MFAPNGPPVFVFDAEQSDFPKGLHNRSTRLSGALRIRTRGVNVEVPERFRLADLPERLIYDDPASQFARTLGYRYAADALRNVLGSLVSPG